MHTARASEVLMLNDGRITITSTSCRGSRPSCAVVGAGCSNQLQVAQGQGLVRDCALVQAAIGCCILLLLVPKMVLTLCNLRWWCFSCHQLAQRPHLHLQWASPATCAGGVFLVPASAFSYYCAHMTCHACCHRPLQIALALFLSFTNQAFTNVHICT